MKNVTDKQQERHLDPWNDHPDPRPEDFEPYLTEMRPGESEYFPGDTDARLILIDGDEDVNDWIKRRDAAHARGERLPEEIRADELAEEELARRAREALEQDQH